MLEWITAIGAILSAIGAIVIPLILIDISKKEKLKNEKFLLTERISKLYSYPIATNNCKSNISYNNESFDGFTEFTNNINFMKLINIDLNNKNNKILNAYIEFENITNIMPYSILIHTLIIQFHDESDTLFELNFENYNNKNLFIPIYKIDANAIYCSLPCIITQSQLDIIKENQEIYKSIYIILDISFKNIFNIVTRGQYSFSYDLLDYDYMMEDLRINYVPDKFNNSFRIQFVSEKGINIAEH